jgi:hypothetical protein
MVSLPRPVLERASRLTACAIQHQSRGFHHTPSRTPGFIVAEAQKGVGHLTESETEPKSHHRPLPNDVSPSNDLLPSIPGRRGPVGRVRTLAEITDVPSLDILSRLHVESLPGPRIPMDERWSAGKQRTWTPPRSTQFAEMKNSETLDPAASRSSRRFSTAPIFGSAIKDDGSRGTWAPPSQPAVEGADTPRDLEDKSQGIDKGEGIS